jgi:hypothetical protein
MCASIVAPHRDFVVLACPRRQAHAAGSGASLRCLSPGLESGSGKVAAAESGSALWAIAAPCDAHCLCDQLDPPGFLAVAYLGHDAHRSELDQANGTRTRERPTRLQWLGRNELG